MDDYRLKQILKQQAASFDEDVDKKMAFLQSDDFLNCNFYQYDFLNQADDEITSAFRDSQGNDMMEAFVSQSKDDDSDSETDYQKRKKRIAERIASLRGTSLPGGYLRNYKF